MLTTESDFDTARAAILDFNRETSVILEFPKGTLTLARRIASFCKVRFDDVSKASEVIPQNVSEDFAVLCVGTRHALIQFCGVIGESDTMEEFLDEHTVAARDILLY